MRCAESAMIVPVDAHVGVRMTLKGRRIFFLHRRYLAGATLEDTPIRTVFLR